MIKNMLTLFVALALLGMAAGAFAQTSPSKIGTSDYDRANAYNSGSNIDRNLNGQVMVLWATGSNNNYSVLWSTYDELFGLWSTPQVLMSGTNDCRTTKVIADEAGNFHAAFMVDDLSYYSKYDGVSWSTPVMVQKDSLKSRVNSLVIDSNGYIWISWDTYYEPDEQEWLFVTHSEDGGATWPDPDTLGGDLVPDLPSRYAISMLSAGPNGVVGAVYRERNTDVSPRYQLFFQEWDGTKWSDPEYISDFHDSTAAHPFRVDNYWASLVYDSNGKKHVVFYTDDDDWPKATDSQVYYTTNDGTGWTDPVAITESTDGSISYPAIRIDSDDNLYIVWAMDSPPDTVMGRDAPEIWYTTSDDGGKTWATQTQLSTNTHYTTGGVNYRSANISRHIWEAGVGGSSFEGGADVMWFEEDTTLTTGDAYQIYYGRIPKVVVGVKDEKPVGVLGRFELAQNYPNPFNAATRIDFSIPERGDVYLAIYNLLGQRIATLVNKKMNAGSHSLTWNGTDDRGESVASGIYFYKLESKDRVQARKLVLMK